eukprot:6209959-Pleurochrysis_carterae.AAC.2
MPIAGSCTPERPIVNATMGVAMASTGKRVVEMFRFARSFELRYGDTRGPAGLLPAWLALTMVSGVALALASASAFAAIRVRRAPVVVRVLRVSAWSPSLRQGCPCRVRRYGNLRTARRPDKSRDRSFQNEPPQMARRRSRTKILVLDFVGFLRSAMLCRDSAEPGPAPVEKSAQLARLGSGTMADPRRFGPPRCKNLNLLFCTSVL